MPIELVAAGPVAAARSVGRRRFPLVFLVQVAAIVAVAGLTMALASVPSGSMADAAQTVVAGP